MVGAFTWDPDRNLFVIPGLGHPVAWYGFLFALGFFLGYLVIRTLFRAHISKHHPDLDAKREATRLVDRLSLFVILGTLIGARLGHVIFYGWPYYRAYPEKIVRIWEGGLASHGGAIGILIALVLFVLFQRKKSVPLSFLGVLDAIVVPAALAGGFIRIGNFINQEILGVPTDLPWGVSFLHPIDGPRGVPLHPVQLYESFGYFLTFSLLYFVWRRGGRQIGRGVIAGLFFLLVFSFRFCIEFFKLPLSEWSFAGQGLNMGQYLSIPFILLGVFLLASDLWKRRSTA